MATAAGGTRVPHPTGMHYCFQMKIQNKNKNQKNPRKHEHLSNTAIVGFPVKSNDLKDR